MAEFKLAKDINGHWNGVYMTIRKGKIHYAVPDKNDNGDFILPQKLIKELDDLPSKVKNDQQKLKEKYIFPVSWDFLRQILHTGKKGAIRRIVDKTNGKTYWIDKEDVKKGAISRPIKNENKEDISDRERHEIIGKIKDNKIEFFVRDALGESEEREFDVDSYKNRPEGKLKSNNLEADHVPSFEASKARVKENKEFRDNIASTIRGYYVNKNKEDLSNLKGILENTENKKAILKLIDSKKKEKKKTKIIDIIGKDTVKERLKEIINRELDKNKKLLSTIDKPKIFSTAHSLIKDNKDFRKSIIDMMKDNFISYIPTKESLTKLKEELKNPGSTNIVDSLVETMDKNKKETLEESSKEKIAEIIFKEFESKDLDQENGVGRILCAELLKKIDTLIKDHKTFKGELISILAEDFFITYLRDKDFLVKLKEAMTCKENKGIIRKWQKWKEKSKNIKLIELKERNEELGITDDAVKTKDALLNEISTMISQELLTQDLDRDNGLGDKIEAALQSINIDAADHANCSASYGHRQDKEDCIKSEVLEKKQDLRKKRKELDGLIPEAVIYRDIKSVASNCHKHFKEKLDQTVKKLTEIKTQEEELKKAGKISLLGSEIKTLENEVKTWKAKLDMKTNYEYQTRMFGAYRRLYSRLVNERKSGIFDVNAKALTYRFEEKCVKKNTDPLKGAIAYNLANNDKRIKYTTKDKDGESYKTAGRKMDNYFIKKLAELAEKQGAAVNLG